MKKLVICAVLACAWSLGINSESLLGQQPLRIGMIGLDTSHAPAFTKLINNAEEGVLANMKVTSAFPGGSEDIASSRDRLEGFTRQLSEMGVVISNSIDEMLAHVDAVLLESVDGRKHLEQVLPVFKAGKPVFIDKPLAGNLEDALAIDLLAKHYQAKWFSSSSLRFSPGIAAFREDETLRSSIRGAEVWSPCSLEKTHADLYWYGVHGVETLYTAMGPGCEQVTRVHTAGTDVVVGVWRDGRVGTYRGLRDGKSDYGLVVFGEKNIEIGGRYEGYGPLVDRIAVFFNGGATPVGNEETLEMFTFMAAADASKDANGMPVKLAEVRKIALAKAQKKVEALLQE
ncbi:MAG: Gfo/Idh/MocA family oxidoreductase [Planctomycetales bacterium]|nr:Gfo/Idh/MocA family oxidoreductase [Planctomycetales bacterium]